MQRLRESWERAEVRLRAHLPAQHRKHLQHEHLTRIADLDADAYLEGVRTLAAGMG